MDRATGSADCHPAREFASSANNTDWSSIYKNFSFIVPKIIGIRVSSRLERLCGGVHAEQELTLPCRHRGSVRKQLPGKGTSCMRRHRSLVYGVSSIREIPVPVKEGLIPAVVYEDWGVAGEYIVRVGFSWLSRSVAYTWRVFTWAFVVETGWWRRPSSRLTATVAATWTDHDVRPCTRPPRGAVMGRGRGGGLS